MTVTTRLSLLLKNLHLSHLNVKVGFTHTKAFFHFDFGKKNLLERFFKNNFISVQFLSVFRKLLQVKRTK